MAINSKQLRKYIIKPALEGLNLWSQEAEDLVYGTCAQESGCGYYLHQLGTGPACSIYQIEPRTHQDLVKYVEKTEYINWFKSITRTFDTKTLTYNLLYATGMCRMYYYRVPEKIPTTIEGLAEYWKKYYNTVKGKGTVKQFIENYHKYE